MLIQLGTFSFFNFQNFEQFYYFSSVLYVILKQYSAETLPQLLLQRLPHGAAGGDLNSIISLSDSNRNANTKISPSFKTLVTSFAWQDSYRVLFPCAVQYSRVYSNELQGEGASRIDRCYHWGELTVQEAEYHPISFSDHLSLRIVYTLPSRLTHVVAPQARPHFKIPPEIVDDEIFAESISCLLYTSDAADE